jgi:glycosyltransferase involved in cell wall biosynthesis
MNIAILHYAAWPVIGGVETVIRHQAELFAQHGHTVTVFAGEGAAFDPKIRLVLLNELNPARAEVRAAQEEVAQGGPGRAYFRLYETIQRRFVSLLPQFDHIIAHNLLTMPFNFAATQALSEYAQQIGTLVAWTHDLAAMNPDYMLPSHRISGLLRERQPNIRYVAVSHLRAEQFERLTGTVPDAVIPNGLDLGPAIGLTPEVAKLIGKHLETSTLLLYPTRILARKNIEFALQILAALREESSRTGQHAQDARETRFMDNMHRSHEFHLMISGAPNRYQSDNYLDRLKQLAADLGLGERVTWVNEHFRVTDAHLRSLYLGADALLYTTRQEGFGLPLLEAAAYRIPIFCSDIEPLRSLAPPGAVLLDLRGSPRKIATSIVTRLDNDPTFASRKQLIRCHSAQRLYMEKIEPFLTRKP